MIKKLLFLLATVGFVANITGCTSKKAQDDTEIVENADVDKVDADSAATTNLDGTAPEAADDASLQAALGETTPPADSPAPAPDATASATPDATVAPAPDATADSVAAAPDIAAAPTLDESSLNDIPPPTDASVMALNDTPTGTDNATVDNSANAAPAATEIAPAPETTSETAAVENAPTESTFTPSEPAPMVEATVSTPAKPAGSTLKKVATTTPYQASTGWVNTVYVARPGEKLKQISQTIYGIDKSKELKKIAENSFLKSRSVRPGDKIYYVSPNRPDDSSKMLMYYEDVGMVPETYVAKKGDRLKKVAKKILGYDKAWVEMWTSNPVESKDKLAEGETLKYWRSASSISAPAEAHLAQNTPTTDTGAAQLVDQSQMPTPPPADMNQPDSAQNLAQNATPPPTDMNSLPPPPQQDMPAPPPPDMNAPPPPPGGQAAVGATGANAPPPPDMNAPPPPPPPDMTAGADHPAGTPGAPDHGGKKKFNPAASAEEESAMGGLDQDTMLSLGAVGVLTIALAFVLISRRRKKRAAEQAMTEHNVGT